MPTENGARLLKRLLDKKSLKGRLVIGTSGSFFLHVLFTGMSFVSGVFLARILGSENFGTYHYALSLVAVLTVPALLGLPPLLIRSVGRYRTLEEWGLVRGIVGRARVAILTSSLLIAAGAAGVAWWLEADVAAAPLLTFWIALFLLPVGAFLQAGAATMQGLHHVLVGQLPSSLVRPGLFLVFVSVVYVLFDGNLSPMQAMTAKVSASALALSVTAFLVHTRLNAAIPRLAPRYKDREWVKAALPLLVLAALMQVNREADVLMLGALADLEAVGLYRPATRIVMLVGFGLQAINLAIQPEVIRLHTQGDMQKLQRLASFSARANFAYALPIALIIVFFGQWILWIYGREYMAADTALAILTASQVINAAMGSVALLLTMTGHQVSTVKAVMASAMLNIILNAALIPGHGIEGAAIATAASQAVWHIWLAIVVYRRLGIHSTALGVKIPEKVLGLFTRRR